jgi:hypothetical protein
MSDQSLKKDLKNREKVLKWMAKHNIRSLVQIAEIVSMYNKSPENLLKRLQKKDFRLVLSK